MKKFVTSIALGALVLFPSMNSLAYAQSDGEVVDEHQVQSWEEIDRLEGEERIQTINSYLEASGFSSNNIGVMSDSYTDILDYDTDGSTYTTVTVLLSQEGVAELYNRMDAAADTASWTSFWTFVIPGGWGVFPALLLQGYSLNAVNDKLSEAYFTNQRLELVIEFGSLSFDTEISYTVVP
ncbi:hypothetical protein [Bacillus sp. Marseille-P3800]|uniref:hypothetical protein n=1 Tax=Bacillus sp. Marseille-P3800 TaxID=2014782 RepID=UPI000C06D27B|nr:hypothetical protein [Bacillus sp. Marseille-P3800]